MFVSSVWVIQINAQREKASGVENLRKSATEFTSYTAQAVAGHHCGVHSGHALLPPQAVGCDGAIVWRRRRSLLVLGSKTPAKKNRHNVTTFHRRLNLQNPRRRVDFP
jgi:hypothetical protein